MNSYHTLKIAAGRWNFTAGESIDLPADEAEMLIAAGAIRSLDPEPKLVAPKQKRKSKKAEANGSDSDNAA
jgi:hypothetical protein